MSHWLHSKAGQRKFIKRQNRGWEYEKLNFQKHLQEEIPIIWTNKDKKLTTENYSPNQRFKMRRSVDFYVKRYNTWLPIECKGFATAFTSPSDHPYKTKIHVYASDRWHDTWRAGVLHYSAPTQTTLFIPGWTQEHWFKKNTPDKTAQNWEEWYCVHHKHVWTWEEYVRWIRGGR